MSRADADGPPCPDRAVDQRLPTPMGDLTILTRPSFPAGSMPVKPADFTATAPFTSGLAAGDLILLYQPQGATIDNTTSVVSYGAVTALNGAGNYELAHVASVAGTCSSRSTCLRSTGQRWSSMSSRHRSHPTPFRAR